MTSFAKRLSLLLALLMLLSVVAVFTGCGETQEGPDVTRPVIPLPTPRASL